MIKILAIEDSRIDAVGYWRVFEPFQVMRKMFPGTFEIEYKKENLTYADIVNSDVVFMTRPDNPAQIDFIKQAKKHGKGTIFVCDCDDDYFDLPNCHPMAIGMRKQRSQRLKVTKDAWELADILWFSTEYLQKKYGGMYIPNAILPEMLPDEPAPDRGRVVWRGHSIQLHDLMLSGQNQYPEILKAANYFAWVAFMPPFPGWEKAIHMPANKAELEKLYDAKKTLGETPVVMYPPIPNPADYIDLMKNDRFNYVWKPMLDCGFNHAKSNISLIEATIGGGVCLTNFAGKRQWENATSRILTRHRAVALWEAACAQIKKEYNLRDTARLRAMSILHRLGLLPAETKTAADAAP